MVQKAGSFAFQHHKFKMYSVSILGSVRRVECKFNSPAPPKVRLLTQTPISAPVPRSLLVNIPILTGMFEEHEVILATTGESDEIDNPWSSNIDNMLSSEVDNMLSSEIDNMWSFEVSTENIEFLQQQLNLPVCVLCGLDSAIYLQRLRYRDEGAVATRIRGNV